MYKSVWIVRAWVQYEPSDIMGIYDSKEKAQESCDALAILIGAGRPDDEEDWEPTEGDYYDGCDIERYDLNRGWDDE